MDHNHYYWLMLVKTAEGLTAVRKEDTEDDDAINFTVFVGDEIEFEVLGGTKTGVVIEKCYCAEGDELPRWIGRLVGIYGGVKRVKRVVWEEGEDEEQVQAADAGAGADGSAERKES